MSNNRFDGLTMPVFTAFGWADEENALNFALSQLELFIGNLYYALDRDIQAFFPFHGLDRASQSVYLATSEVPQSGLYIAFLARPLSFEISLVITDKSTLNKAYKAVENQSDVLFTMLKELGPEWSLRLQQMEFDEESGVATHYQDILKTGINALNNQTLTDSIARAVFLNNESQWVTPLYISQRTDSEKIAFMGRQVISVIAERIDSTAPLCRLLTGQTKKKPRAKAKATPKLAEVPQEVIELPIDAFSLEHFTFLSELQPLHIRRGFINLTPQHWPFFALNVRTETRKVTLVYGSQIDKDSAVWRLVPSDQTRIVLSPKVQEWLEENFSPHDYIHITAKKANDTDINMVLAPVE